VVERKGEGEIDGGGEGEGTEVRYVSYLG